MGDPRESSSYSLVPRIRYNTVGGVNGPLVILDNVRAREEKLTGRIGARRESLSYVGADSLSCASR